MLDHNRKFYSAFRGLSFPLRMILTRGDECYFISSSGIANTLDLTDRILPRLQTREKCKPRLLNFPPYTKNQIATILQDRLNQVSANHCIKLLFFGSPVLGKLHTFKIFCFDCFTMGHSETICIWISTLGSIYWMAQCWNKNQSYNSHSRAPLMAFKNRTYEKTILKIVKEILF